MMSKPQQIFLQSHQMMVEHFAECAEPERHQKAEDELAMDGLIGVNQNLPSAGQSSSPHTLSRTESFTFEEDLPWTTTRKYSFEMIETCNQNLKETSKSKMDGLFALNSFTAQHESLQTEFRPLQKARSHSITSIDGSFPSESSNQQQNFFGQTKTPTKIPQNMFENARTRTNPLVSAALTPKASMIGLKLVETQPTTRAITLGEALTTEKLLQPKEEHSLPTNTAVEQEASRLEFFDLEEQMCLANASIPEGKNGKCRAYLSPSKHLGLRQKHDLQPNRVAPRC